MIIAITFPTSAIFWLNYNSRCDQNAFSLKNRKTIDLPAAYEFEMNIENATAIAAALDLPLPITVFAPSANERCFNKAVRSAVRHKKLPGNAFVELAKQFDLPNGEKCRILMEIPEMVFVQAAMSLDITKAIIIGCELCGSYIYDDNAEYDQRNKHKIASEKSIKSFIAENVGRRGIDKARIASRYISDNANSRVEVFLSVLSKLSFPMGGYNLKPFKLNTRPVLSEEGKGILGNREMYCDIIWEEDKLIAEYDSDLTHLSSNQHMLDKKRINALQLSGYKVITITKNDIATLNQLDEMFVMLRRKLGLKSNLDKIEMYKSERRKLLLLFREFRSNKIEAYDIR